MSPKFVGKYSQLRPLSHIHSLTLKKIKAKSCRITREQGEETNICHARLAWSEYDHHAITCKRYSILMHHTLKQLGHDYSIIE